MLTAPEQAYSSFAAEHGLCPVNDFYRGAAQAVFAFASMLGPVNKTRSASNSVQQLIRDQPGASAWAQADPDVAETLKKTAVEDELCETDDSDSAASDSTAAAAASQRNKAVFKGLEYPSFERATYRQFDLNERAAVKKKSSLEAVQATQFVRGCLSPSLRKPMYEIIAASTMPHIQGAIWSTWCRMYHAPARDDEILEALNIASFELVPNGMATSSSSSASATEGDDEDASAKEEATKQETKSSKKSDWSSEEANLRRKLDEMTSTHDVRVTVNALFRVPQERYVHNWAFFRKRMRFSKLKDAAATSAASDTAPDDASSKKATSSNVSAASNGSSSAKSVDSKSSSNDSKKNKKSESDGDDDHAADRDAAVVAHYGGSEAAANLACDNMCRILAVSGAFNVFRAIDYISRTVFKHKDGAMLDPRAFPLQMMGLSETFPTQPARYVKNYIFVYNKTLQHWRLAGAGTQGHYLRDFDSGDFSSRGGFVPESTTGDTTEVKK